MNISEPTVSVLRSKEKSFQKLLNTVVFFVAHSFFAVPNPLSCSVMNKIYLNQLTLEIDYSAICVIP